MKKLFLSADEFMALKQSQEHEVAKGEISLFKILNIFGNLLPLIIAIGISLLLFHTKDENIDKSISCDYIIKISNNGSLPLICYSLILSSIIFLLDKTEPSQESLRKKVLAISVLLLFISISLYTLLTAQSDSISDNGHILLFGMSILLFWFTIIISKCMILLQKKIVEGGFDKSVKHARAIVKEPTSVNVEDDEIKFDER